MKTKHNKLNLSIDLRILVIVLLVIITGMLIVWKPWHDSATDERTIEVTGQASLKSEPDEYSFNPQYTSTASTKQAAIDELNKKSTEIITKLKTLSVTDSQIKSSVNGYDSVPYSKTIEPQPVSSGVEYTLSLTISVATKDQAQKVEDYLATTTPQGSVTPYVTFSTTKRKQLERQARDEATADARKTADQTAKNLGFKIVKVKSVTDSAGYPGGPIPYDKARGVSISEDSPAPSIISSAVQPGQDQIEYSVTVVFYVK